MMSIVILWLSINALYLVDRFIFYNYEKIGYLTFLKKQRRSGLLIFITIPGGALLSMLYFIATNTNLPRD